MNTGDREGEMFRAALLRPLLAVVAFFVLPPFVRRPEVVHVALTIYLCGALLGLLMLWRRVGGLPRAGVTGALDLAIVLFFMHLLGSTSPLLLMLLVFVGTIYAVVVERRLAQALATVGALAYAGVVWGEALGFLPHAPDGPDWMATVPPHPLYAAAITLFFPVFSVGSVSMVGHLVDRVRQREEELERLSRHDPLTGLFNRRHFLERLEEELHRRRRGHATAIAMIDLDGFKHINDEQGHQRGDDLLRELARALREATRRVDVVARYGGDEFLVLLPDTGPEAARVVLERLVRRIREVGEGFDPVRPVTASVGVAHLQRDDTVESLLHRADQRAYLAKRAGGDGCRDADVDRSGDDLRPVAPAETDDAVA